MLRLHIKSELRIAFTRACLIFTFAFIFLFCSHQALSFSSSPILREWATSFLNTNIFSPHSRPTQHVTFSPTYSQEPPTFIYPTLHSNQIQTHGRQSLHIIIVSSPVEPIGFGLTGGSEAMIWLVARQLSKHPVVANVTIVCVEGSVVRWDLLGHDEEPNPLSDRQKFSLMTIKGRRETSQTKVSAGDPESLSDDSVLVRMWDAVFSSVANDPDESLILNFSNDWLSYYLTRLAFLSANEPRSGEARHTKRVSVGHFVNLCASRDTLNSEIRTYARLHPENIAFASLFQMSTFEPKPIPSLGPARAHADGVINGGPMVATSGSASSGLIMASEAHGGRLRVLYPPFDPHQYVFQERPNTTTAQLLHKTWQTVEGATSGFNADEAHSMFTDVFVVPFGWAGRITPEKGLADAMEAVLIYNERARAENRPLGFLLIAGVIENTTYWQELNERYGNGKKIPRFYLHVGYLKTEQFQRLLGACHAFLMPINWDEAYGMVMAESMFTGTPVVAYRKAAAVEVVEYGITGFLVNATSSKGKTGTENTGISNVPSVDGFGKVGPEGLASAMRAIRSIDRKKCRDRAVERFGVDTQTKKWVEWVEALTNRKLI